MEGLFYFLIITYARNLNTNRFFFGDSLNLGYSTNHVLLRILQNGKYHRGKVAVHIVALVIPKSSKYLAL
jgi:hypothetical protein